MFARDGSVLQSGITLVPIAVESRITAATLKITNSVRFAELICEVTKVNITDKRTPPMVRYSELPVGAVFDACGDIAIKCADGDAVCLRDGNYICRQPSDMVTPLNAEVVIS